MKIVEKSNLAVNNQFELLQSGFREKHSSEMAIAQVSNDLLLVMDSHTASILLLLNFSAAFDTVDHNILL